MSYGAEMTVTEIRLEPLARAAGGGGVDNYEVVMQDPYFNTRVSLILSSPPDFVVGDKFVLTLKKGGDE